MENRGRCEKEDLIGILKKHTEEARIKSRKEWLNKYKKEAKKGSRALRTMTFRRTDTSGPTVTVTRNDGTVITYKDEVMHEYAAWYEALGRDNVSPEESEVNRQKLQEFIADSTRYGKIKEEIKKKESNIN